MTKTYEVAADHEEDIKQLAKLLPKGLPIVELGGGLGYSSCYMNALLRPKSHIVVEANPDLVPRIEKKRDAEHCRFEVLNRALSYTAPEITFNVDTSFVASSERRASSPTIVERIRIPTVKLRDLLMERSVVVSDIEGNEIDMIKNDMEALKKHAAYLIVEFHERISGKWRIRLALLKLRLNGFKLLKIHEICQVCPSYLFANKRLAKSGENK